MTKYIFLLLPIIISFLVYIQSLKKDNLSLIAELTKEISSKRPTPYIVESLVSKIHFMRPIPYNALIVILRRNNSYEILTHLSRCRRLLKLVTPVTINHNITFEFTPLFNTRFRLVFIMLLCITVASLSFNEMLNISELLFDNFEMIDIYAEAKSYRLNLEQLDMFKNIMEISVAFFFYFIFSTQLLTIAASLWRVKILNKLIIKIND